ncbi:glycosyltransferase [Fluviispira sanaruensis]|uniref:Glycosyltransferase family 1 protein n=1 Tax=Fluviispira sanaruensis TaxID=2493639 RepID=A0A4P2VWQ5_FLUSA|nr:glycosyltransferase [Fluviispira sanaruensis]BBH54045.1 glycosyltransferase family 1 protein [Fluviispira sanaruensis]
MKCEIKVLLFWEGLPACALITKKIVEDFGENLTFIATKPDVPFEKLEEKIGKNIIWLSHPNEIWIRKDEFLDHEIIIHTGWCWKKWLKFDKYMKKSGAKICVSVDNRFKLNFRQFIGAFYFRLFLRPIFDHVFVPGESGIKLMKFLGMKKNAIFTGLYGCDENIFFNKKIFSERKSQFIFVGQLIHRKGIDILIKSFQNYKQNNGKWSLRIIGGKSWDNQYGFLDKNIIYSPFLQPEEISIEMSNSKCFVLPSRDDHWATVVHEATRCGLPLLLSRAVGAHEDLLEQGKNGFLVHKNIPNILEQLMHKIESLDNENKLYHFHNKSLELSKKFGIDSYSKSFHRIVNAAQK